MSLKVESTSEPDCFRVSGRGDLHLSVLMETMRREGYEWQFPGLKSFLRVENGKPREPFEYLTIDVPEMYMGERHGRVRTKKSGIC